MTFGDNVRKRRLELGLSQQELANKIGVSSRSMINKIESGRNVSQKMIIRISNALNCTPADLLDWKYKHIKDDSPIQYRDLFEEYAIENNIPEYDNPSMLTENNFQIMQLFNHLSQYIVENNFSEEETNDLIRYAKLLVNGRGDK